MKKTIILVVLILTGCEAPVNQETISSEGESILIGEINWTGLAGNPYREWFVPGYQSYVVDSLSLSDLAPELTNIDVTLFMGTWCEDSQVQVPQFYKILDYLHFNMDQLQVIGLEKEEDGRLVSPQHEESGLDIGFVPTIIFVRNGEELGRITEYPRKSLEKDMAEIIKGEGI